MPSIFKNVSTAASAFGIAITPRMKVADNKIESKET